jgi:N-acetylneuraminic acid mutarotase
MYFSTGTVILLLLNALGVVASPTRSHLREPSWKSLAPIPISLRQEHTTVFLPPHTIAILGGVIPSNTSIPPVDTTAIMQLYNISSNTWSTRSSMPRALNHVNVAVVEGLIYVLGGLAETNETKRAWRPTGESWVYDSAVDAWDELPSMPEGEERGSAAVGVYGEKIYLAAGSVRTELYEGMLESVC